MSRTLAAFVAGSLAAVAAGTANAADLSAPQGYPKAPAPYHALPPLFTWQGFYVGINAGYGWASSTLTGTAIVTGTSEVSPTGFIGGATYGYNVQAGALVYGVEADIDYSWMKDTAEAVAPCPGCEVRNHYLATARARLGYAMDRWMPYVTGGVAFGDISVAGPTGARSVTHKVGWAAGGGIEYAHRFWNMSTKLEYLYADLGTATCEIGHCLATVEAGYTASIVRLGVNFHF